LAGLPSDWNGKDNKEDVQRLFVLILQCDVGMAGIHSPSIRHGLFPELPVPPLCGNEAQWGLNPPRTGIRVRRHPLPRCTLSATKSSQQWTYHQFRHDRQLPRFFSTACPTGMMKNPRESHRNMSFSSWAAPPLWARWQLRDQYRTHCPVRSVRVTASTDLLQRPPVSPLRESLTGSVISAWSVVLAHQHSPPSTRWTKTCLRFITVAIQNDPHR
jgi:hypothetical protein